MNCRARLLISALLLSTAPRAVLAQTQLPGLIIETPRVQGATLQKAPVQPSAAPSTAPAAATGNEAAGAANGEGPTAGVPASTIGSSVTVVTGADLQRQQVRQVTEALRSLPGVSVVQTGGVASLTEVRIRGAEANHTLVLIDGIQANDTANGQFDFSSLTTEDIDRIEVIRGPQSGLYGSGAIGGVINITTRKPRGPLSLALRAEYGSFDTRDIAARLAGGNDKGYVSLSGQLRTTDGFNISPFGPEPFSGNLADDDGARLSNFALNAGGRLTPNASLDLVLRRTNKRGERDGDGFGGFFGRYATSVDDPSFFRQTMTLAGATLKVDTLDSALTHEVRLNHNATRLNDSDRGAFGPSEFVNDSQRTTASYGATYRFGGPGAFGRHALTGQLQHEAERFTPLSDFDDKLERGRNRLSFTGEWRGTFADQLDLTAGARRDDNDQFPDFTTWRGTASWRVPGAGLRPHASIGTAVKMPDMFQQFGRSAGFIANPNLQPEESRGWDAGVELTMLGGKAILDVTYFRSNLTDKISPVFVGFSTTVVNRVGESTREGAEVSGRFLLTPTLSLGAAYTYTDARDPDGTVTVRRPPHSGRADVRYLFGDGKGSLSVAAIYNGRRFDNALDTMLFTNDKVPLDGYWLLSSALSYKIQPNVELYGRVENALNTKYQEIYGYGTAGAAAYAGVKISFDDIGGVGAGRR